MDFYSFVLKWNTSRLISLLTFQRDVAIWDPCYRMACSKQEYCLPGYKAAFSFRESPSTDAILPAGRLEPTLLAMSVMVGFQQCPVHSATESLLCAWSIQQQVRENKIPPFRECTRHSGSVGNNARRTSSWKGNSMGHSKSWTPRSLVCVRVSYVRCCLKKRI